MLAIRLQRNGRKALPLYRIVVQEAQRHPLSGRRYQDAKMGQDAT